MGQCRARLSSIFWDELRVRALGPRSRPAPAHTFSEQDAPHLAAAYLDAYLVGGLGYSVQHAAFVSSSGWSPPPGSVSSLPGGSLETRAMILERSSSVMRGLRPAPGRSPSPSIPSALKRWSGFLTVFG